MKYYINSKLIIYVVLASYFFTNSVKSQCVEESTFSNLLWSSYLGGDGEEEVVDIYVDVSTGIQYALGKTNSSNFYSTNPVIGTISSGYNTFVMAINPDASLLWSTLIGGWDDPQAIDLGPDRNLTLVGVTDLPTLPGPTGLPGYDKSYNGGKDILILKMATTGLSIVYSSYYGGTSNDSHRGDPATPFVFDQEKLKVDFNESKIYILGVTTSNDLPLINSIDANPGNGFAAVLDVSLNGSMLEFGTYIQKISGGITSLDTGGFALVTDNANGDYRHLISQNAIEGEYEGFLRCQFYSYLMRIIV